MSALAITNAPAPALDAGWRAWVLALWPSLVVGGRAVVPDALPHPRDAGFRRPRLAERVGQVADWVHPLSDGSRLHVHEFVDGRLVLHRDRFDPRGLSAVVHWFAESRKGRSLAVYLGGALRRTTSAFTWGAFLAVSRSAVAHTRWGRP